MIETKLLLMSPEHYECLLKFEMSCYLPNGEFNEREWIRYCIESLGLEEYTHYEIKVSPVHGAPWPTTKRIWLSECR